VEGILFENVCTSNWNKYLQLSLNQERKKERKKDLRETPSTKLGMLFQDGNPLTSFEFSRKRPIYLCCVIRFCEPLFNSKAPLQHLLESWHNGELYDLET